MAGNLLIVHGGGPTAVINCSLYGAVDEAKKSGKIGKIYGAEGGMGGVLAERFIRLDAVSDFQLSMLKTTPGSAIGTSRDAMEAEDYAKDLQDILRKNGYPGSKVWVQEVVLRTIKTHPYSALIMPTEVYAPDERYIICMKVK